MDFVQVLDCVTFSFQICHIFTLFFQLSLQFMLFAGAKYLPRAAKQIIHLLQKILVIWNQVAFFKHSQRRCSCILLIDRYDLIASITYMSIPYCVWLFPSHCFQNLADHAKQAMRDPYINYNSYSIECSDSIHCKGCFSQTSDLAYFYNCSILFKFSEKNCIFCSQVIIPPDGYLKSVRNLCSKYNVLMIADEIQSGLARSGKMLACDWEEVRPDVVVNCHLPFSFQQLILFLVMAEIFASFLVIWTYGYLNKNIIM